MRNLATFLGFWLISLALICGIALALQAFTPLGNFAPVIVVDMSIQDPRLIVNGDFGTAFLVVVLLVSFGHSIAAMRRYGKRIHSGHVVGSTTRQSATA